MVLLVVTGIGCATGPLRIGDGAAPVVAAPLLITGVGVLPPVGLGAGGLPAVGLGAGGLPAADGTVTVPVSAPQPDKATTTTIIAAGSIRFTTIVDLR